MAYKKQRKGYITVSTYVDVDVDVHIDDVIDEITDKELIDECRQRGLFHVEKKETLYRQLCDIAEVNYHTDKEQLLEHIKSII